MGAQLPSNMLITRIRPSWYLPSAAIAWSFVSACTALTTNFGSLVAVRFFLGIVEAPLFPGAVYVMSCWYTRRELALRYACLYTGLVLAMAISGLIAAGVFSGMSGLGGLAGWQWLFILEGCVGGLIAMGAIFILPDYPDSNTGSARWSMTPEMRRVAAARMAADRVSEPETDRSVWRGLKMSLTDYKTYLFVSTDPFVHANVPCQRRYLYIPPITDLHRKTDALQSRHHGRVRVQQLLPLHR